MALLAGLHHERATDPRIGELLAIVEESALVAEPGSVSGMSFRELRRIYTVESGSRACWSRNLCGRPQWRNSEWVTARAPRLTAAIPGSPARGPAATLAEMCK